MPTALITGGHGGIGYSAARQLTSYYKWDLLLAGRSPDKMERAAADLHREFGVSVTTIAMDTSSLKSVRAGADRVKQMLKTGEIASLDAVLCNAGGRVDGPVQFSDDGYEMTFAGNCLGHFLLANLLADRLAPQGRIVFTASGTHDPATIDGRMVGAALEPDGNVLANMGKPGTNLASVGKRYSTSKLVNVLNAYELDRRLHAAGSTVAAMAFDPGLVTGTGFLRGLPGPVRGLMLSSFMPWLFKRMGITIGSIQFSGASLAAVATDSAYAGGGGKYFQCNDGKLSETRSSVVSYDEARASRLWEQMAVLARMQPQETPLSN